jgi:hypothetical protein
MRLQLLKLPRDTLDGFLVLVFPLLLRRRDMSIGLFTRERKTAVYDVRVQVATIRSGDGGGVGQGASSGPGPPPLAPHQVGLGRAPHHPAAASGVGSQGPSALQPFTALGVWAEPDLAVWTARYRIALKAAVTGFVDEGDDEDDEHDNGEEESGHGSSVGLTD